MNSCQRNNQSSSSPSSIELGYFHHFLLRLRRPDEEAVSILEEADWKRRVCVCFEQAYKTIIEHTETNRERYYIDDFDCVIFSTVLDLVTTSSEQPAATEASRLNDAFRSVLYERFSRSSFPQAHFFIKQRAPMRGPATSDRYAIGGPPGSVQSAITRTWVQTAVDIASFYCADENLSQARTAEENEAGRRPTSIDQRLLVSPTSRWIGSTERVFIRRVFTSADKTATVHDSRINLLQAIRQQLGTSKLEAQSDKSGDGCGRIDARQNCDSRRGQSEGHSPGHEFILRPGFAAITGFARGGRATISAPQFPRIRIAGDATETTTGSADKTSETIAELRSAPLSIQTLPLKYGQNIRTLEQLEQEAFRANDKTYFDFMLTPNYFERAKQSLIIAPCVARSFTLIEAVRQCAQICDAYSQTYASLSDSIDFLFDVFSDAEGKLEGAANEWFRFTEQLVYSFDAYISDGGLDYDVVHKSCIILRGGNNDLPRILATSITELFFYWREYVGYDSRLNYANIQNIMNTVYAAPNAFHLHYPRIDDAERMSALHRLLYGWAFPTDCATSYVGSRRYPFLIISSPFDQCISLPEGYANSAELMKRVNAHVAMDRHVADFTCIKRTNTVLRSPLWARVRQNFDLGSYLTSDAARDAPAFRLHPAAWLTLLLKSRDESYAQAQPKRKYKSITVAFTVDNKKVGQGETFHRNVSNAFFPATSFKSPSQQQNLRSALNSSEENGDANDELWIAACLKMDFDAVHKDRPESKEPLNFPAIASEASIVKRNTAATNQSATATLEHDIGVSPKRAKQEWSPVSPDAPRGRHQNASADEETICVTCGKVGSQCACTLLVRQDADTETTGRRLFSPRFQPTPFPEVVSEDSASSASPSPVSSSSAHTNSTGLCAPDSFRPTVSDEEFLSASKPSPLCPSNNRQSPPLC